MRSIHDAAGSRQQRVHLYFTRDLHELNETGFSYMYRVIHAFRRMHAEDPPDFTAALAEACLDIDSVDCGLTVRPQPALEVFSRPCVAWQ